MSGFGAEARSNYRRLGLKAQTKTTKTPFLSHTSRSVAGFQDARWLLQAVTILDEQAPGRSVELTRR